MTVPCTERVPEVDQENVERPGGCSQHTAGPGIPLQGSEIPMPNLILASGQITRSDQLAIELVQATLAKISATEL